MSKENPSKNNSEQLAALLDQAGEQPELERALEAYLRVLPAYLAVLPYLQPPESQSRARPARRTSAADSSLLGE